jgi:hypothetical protein
MTEKNNAQRKAVEHPFPYVKYSMLLVCLLACSTFQAATAQQIKVMKQGLGYGTIHATTASAGPIDCGATCDAASATGALVDLTADPADADSRFVRWEGNFPATAVITANRIQFAKPAGITTVRATFDLVVTAPRLRADQINPDSIRVYLNRNAAVNSMATFVRALPDEYKQNWILMTRSESLQTGTAKYPRILLPSNNARNVFTLGLIASKSYPGSDPNAIEYMQWDENLKTFRFHEIILNSIRQRGVIPPRSRSVTIDDTKCFRCHSTQNIKNNSTHAGTTGFPVHDRPNEVVKSKLKPNWDTYDSWAGMLPFNRDRLYQGTLEETAFRSLFNLWNWRSSPRNDSIHQVYEQLQLQPPMIASVDMITRNIDLTTDAAHLTIAFGRSDAIRNRSTNHNFGNPPTASFFTVAQGGNYITMKHTTNASSAADDEGRGVFFFDLLGGNKGNLNQTRVADELARHKFATGSHLFDVRPIALAILRGIITIDGAGNVGSTTAEVLTDARVFFNPRNALLVTDNIASLRTDTEARAKSLPRRKADLQRANIDRTFPDLAGTGRQRDAYLVENVNGLYREYIGAIDPTVDYIRQQVFKRPPDTRTNIIPPPAFAPSDSVNGDVYVDRERYDLNSDKVTLLRYFLEPLGVSVSAWSMGVRARAATYTFADIFGSYEGTISSALGDSLALYPPQMPAGFVGTFNVTNNEHLMKAVNESLRNVPSAIETPKYTDVQRIFNKTCEACHGGLDYPPYFGYGSMDFSEQEEPISFGSIPLMYNGNNSTMSPRLWRAYYWAASKSAAGLSSILYRKISDPTLSERHSFSLMPSGGPRLSIVDIETIRRWIVGMPSRPFSLGDPHLKTLDGINYDFQADGEFVLLRGDFVEIQTRQKAVATNNPLGPNEYTGLTSCVSLNAAAAIFVAGHRITYQPNSSGKPDPDGMQLRIDGNLVSLSELPKPFALSSRIVSTGTPGGIQIESVGGTVIALTPMFWDYYQVWYLNIDVIQSRATDGLMGVIKPGNWLPALPDGAQLGAMPADLAERFRMLYGIFGEAWRVTDATSLFDYASGTSTATFTNKNWPANKEQNCIPPKDKDPQKPVSLEEAERLCTEVTDPERRALCIKDLMATGEVSFAKAYLASDKITRNKYPQTPKLEFPSDAQEITGTSIDLRWLKTTDEDGDPIRYRVYVWDVNDMDDNNQAVDVRDPGGLFGPGVWHCPPILLIITLLIIIILFFLLWKKRKWLFYLLVILVLILAALAYMYGCKDKTTTITYHATGLQSGKRYFWKVIAEDNNNGVTESETWRIDVK